MYEKRLSRVFGVFAAALLLLGARAFSLQVSDREDVLAEQEARVHGRFVLPPHRGEILWRDGAPAAWDEPSWSVRIDPDALRAKRSRCPACGAPGRRVAGRGVCRECGSDAAPVPVPPPDLSRLAEVLEVSQRDLADGCARVRKEHDLYPTWRWHELLKDVSRDAAVALTLASSEFPGVVPAANPRRATDPAAACIAGRVRPAFVEDVEELTDATRADRGERVYRASEVRSMRFGARGLEKAFDDLLRGEPGRAYLPVRRPNRVRTPVIDDPVVDGKPLRTSLRREVQVAAAEIVEAAAADAAAVVLDLADGGVVAIASKAADGLDHAVCGRRPGSVFKVVTAVALLEAGISPDETVSCARRGRLPSGREYVCDAAHGSLSFSDAFAHSCNAYFRAMAERVGAQALERACVRLGLDTGPRLHLAGTPAGLERSPGAGHWPDAHAGMIGIGMGEATASPLQIAVAYARIACGGRCLTPWLAEPERPPPPGVDPVLARFSSVLRSAARRVVTQGTAASVEALGAVGAAGKSGTGDLPGSSANNAWFVAFAPHQAPRYVAVVLYENVPGHGASTVGPHVGRLLAEALR